MTKFLSVTLFLISGFFFTETAYAQSIARLAHADLCVTTVTLNWAGGCAPSTTIPVPTGITIDVLVPCGGSSLVSATVQYSGQPAIPVFWPASNPAVSCTGRSTSVDVSTSAVFYYFDINF